MLPFANISDDKEQRFLSDGITEDIITELARFRQMHVLARNSSFRYRGSDLDMVRVGRELGVQYLLEGSVRRIGTRLRITAQLVDVEIGPSPLWAEKFDRDQNEFSPCRTSGRCTIVTTLAGRVQAAGAECRPAARRRPASRPMNACCAPTPCRSTTRRAGAEARAALREGDRV